MRVQTIDMADERAMAELRTVPRNAVRYHTLAFGPDARGHVATVLDLSPHGLMAEIKGSFAETTRLRFRFPVVGVVIGEVRWTAGQRLGCRFEQSIDRSSYYEMLAKLLPTA